jgi:hypothetical protein
MYFGNKFHLIYIFSLNSSEVFMKKTLSTLMAIFVLSFLVVMTSCNKDSGTNDPTTPIVPGVVKAVDQTLLPDQFLPYFNAHNVVVTGSLESPMQNSSPDFCGGGGGGRDTLNPPPPPPGGGNGKDTVGPPPPPPPGMGGRGGMCPGNPMQNDGGFEFRQILNRLQVTRAQFPVIQKVIWDYQLCVQTVMSKTFAARKEIMYAAEQQRRTIMTTFQAALKAAKGDTAAIHAARDAAMTALKALNTDTQTKLDALIDKAALCDCWTKMVTAIEATLTTTVVAPATQSQLDLFKAWLAKQKTPCDAQTSGN